MNEIKELAGSPGPETALSDADIDRLAAALTSKLRPPPGGPPQGARRATTGLQVSQEKKKSASDRDRIKYLTDFEISALFGAIERWKGRDNSPIRNMAIFRVAYHRGLRASEVGRLLIEHLNLRDRRLFVPRLKGGKSVEHFLVDVELKVLRAWIRVRGTGHGPLFPSEQGTPISRYRLDELMKIYGAAAGLPEDKRHFHCLRHSCGTSLVDRDVDLREIQDHLGHRDVASTVIYAQVTDKKRRRTSERLFSEWK